MLKKYFFLIFSFCFFYSYSQERKIIDSLINIVNKTRNEKLKLEYFEKLTTLYWNINTDFIVQSFIILKIFRQK